MCCLKYENDEYEAAKEQLPDLDQRIQTAWYWPCYRIKYFRKINSSGTSRQGTDSRIYVR